MLANYKKQIDYATKFIMDWVKVAVALSLGIVVTRCHSVRVLYSLLPFFFQLTLVANDK